ncbi:putative heterogeneous nuclear ribonucleoprotein 1 [Cocos nucifera]|uniref:Putative heterogeneous nuclear ribonucleoprotein 1 n=1 Tax=Cocos nucifera TaxID=13894 RepID=A0A8K0MWA0_COCNU|nr:putative heterogeneous nuclear ribonucleoprotein 1 [Cocos nucifera]
MPHCDFVIHDGRGDIHREFKNFAIVLLGLEETFTKHFEKYGEITDSVIMKDKHTHMPRGFGFVTFADPCVIDKVLEDEHAIDGRTVEVKRTVPREEMPSKAGLKTKKIFVGGIPPSLTEDELKEHFASYGEVVEHQIMLDHSTGRSRGFGFVTFENEEAVEKIILEGRMHDLGGKQVEIKRAEPKKAGGDPGINGRGARGTGGGSIRGNYRGGTYGYGGSHRSGSVYYGGSYGYGYGRGYSYGAVPSFGAGFSSSYGGPMYGNDGYGSGTTYGGPAGYNGMYGGYGAARGYGSRYHPYGK